MQAGTYLYHGHLDGQASVGIYGMIVVEEPPSKPFPYAVDGELKLLLDDWFHRSIYEQVAGLDAKPFNFIGESQSFLINGKGKYNCSLVPASLTPQLPNAGDVKTCNASSPQCATEYLTVEPGELILTATPCQGNPWFRDTAIPPFAVCTPVVYIQST